MLEIVCVVLKERTPSWKFNCCVILSSRVFTQFLHGGSGESSEITDSEASKPQQSFHFPLPENFAAAARGLEQAGENR